MRVSEVFSLGLLHATAVWSSPVESCNAAPQPGQEFDPVGPYHPGTPMPVSPPRTKTCIVKANSDGTDDSANILEAINKCNDGGRVVFPKDKNFTIGTALDLTFLKHIDLGKYCAMKL